MIFGEYPCCNGDLVLHMPDNSPQFMPEHCPHCGVKVWHKLSRIQSESWTEEDFLVDYDVNHQEKSVKPKKQPDPPSKELADIVEKISKELTEKLTNSLDDFLFSGDDTGRGLSLPLIVDRMRKRGP